MKEKLKHTMKEHPETKEQVKAAAKEAAEKSKEMEQETGDQVRKETQSEGASKSKDALGAAHAEIEKLKAANAELEKKRMLGLADMDNLRKRIAKELETQRYSVMQDTLTPFLQVFEHFSMAVNAATTSDNYKALLQGMDMIQKEFDRAFSDLGIERIDATGKDFDPLLHEAVAQEASDSVAAGKVIRQWSHGYKSGDRLLKPAMVVVSSGPAAAKEAEQK